VEFRSECPPPVLWKLAKDCQEHLSENHWTRTAVLAALMRSVADALLVRDLSRTTQQMNLKHPNPTAPRQTREPGEGGQDEDEQDLPPPQQIVNVVQAVVSWYSDFHSGTLEEAKMAPLAAQIVGGFGMDRKAAEVCVRAGVRACLESASRMAKMMRLMGVWRWPDPGSLVPTTAAAAAHRNPGCAAMHCTIPAHCRLRRPRSQWASREGSQGGSQSRISARTLMYTPPFCRHAIPAPTRWQARGGYCVSLADAVSPQPSSPRVPHDSCGVINFVDECVGERPSA